MERRDLDGDDDELDDAAASFVEDGYARLPNVLSADAVTGLRRAAADNLDRCFALLHARGATPFPEPWRVEENGVRYRYPLACGVRNGFREIVARGPGRYEMPFGCDAGLFTRPEVTRNARLRRLIRRLLPSSTDDDDDDDDFRIGNVSVVASTPGAAEQPWHQDGPHLSVDEHLPCHCLNVFLPLVDLSDDPTLGPTEIRPGTHRHTRRLAPMMLAARARGTLRPPVAPALRAGDALLFDYRVLHRGRANTSPSTVRPVLVVTYCRRWFRDTLNFPSRSLLSLGDGGETKEQESIGTTSDGH